MSKLEIYELPMNNQELKTALHQQIDQADSNFLNILYAMTEAYAQKQQTKIETIAKIITAASDDLDTITKQFQEKTKKTKKKAKPVKRSYSLKDLEQNMEVW